MFRYRVTANENTSVEAVIGDVRSRLDQSDLTESARALALAEVSAIAAQFIANGRKLSGLGSQFRASRDITGEGFSIRVAYAPASSKGWLMRLLGR